jgi:plasmid stability protein
MKQQASLAQYTIRGVPPEVDRALRQKAARRKQSLNRLILEELIAASIGQRRKADFSDLAGKWTPDPAFDEIMAAQRQIDWEKWK